MLLVPPSPSLTMISVCGLELLVSLSQQTDDANDVILDLLVVFEGVNGGSPMEVCNHKR